VSSGKEGWESFDGGTLEDRHGGEDEWEGRDGDAPERREGGGSTCACMADRGSEVH